MALSPFEGVPMINPEEMARDLEALSEKWTRKFQEGFQGWINALLRDAVDPVKLTRFIRSLGVDVSQLGGMVGQQPGVDPYQILGLDKSASDEEVKKRYRELIKKLHPDSAGIESASFLLQMVLASYEMIKRERGWR